MEAAKKKKTTTKGKVRQKKNSKTKEAKVPYSYKPEKMTLEEWQIALRKQYALIQDFEIDNVGEHPVFSDFHVFNKTTQKTYKVAIRDEKSSFNFCS